MVDEKAVVKQSPGDLAGRSEPDSRIYEIIVKFHRDGRPMIEAFLLANMRSVTISQGERSDVLFAYCHFEGDIKELDSKLRDLRQGAMVVLGDKEEKFLDFFIALRQLSQPLSCLLPSPQPHALPSFLKAEWIKGFLVAFGLFIAWQGSQFLSGFISRAANAPPVSSAAPNLVVSQWSPYVLPEYHSGWVEVKKKHGLSDEMTTTLIRRIKRIDKYGTGHHLRDLTIYPGAIDRALGLIILKDVGDAEALRTLYKTLEGYSASWKSLPDTPAKGGISLADSSSTSNDTIVLTFYEQILKEPHREFTERLIKQLRSSHLLR